VVEIAAPPGGIHRMALTAVRAEARRAVIGRLASFIVSRMAAVTFRAHADELVLLLIRMASLAVGRQMLADEGEGRARMALGHVRNYPGLGRMAANAIRAQLAPVQIVMAAAALRVRPFKCEGHMTRTALHQRVLPVQREACGGVVELHRPGQFIP
jgi:hypothetical protein